MAASPWTPSVVPGVEVPSPTKPFPLTTKAGEEVPLSETTNTFSWPVCSIAKDPNGVEEAIPTFPNGFAIVK